MLWYRYSKLNHSLICVCLCWPQELAIKMWIKHTGNPTMTLVLHENIFAFPIISQIQGSTGSEKDGFADVLVTQRARTAVALALPFFSRSIPFPREVKYLSISLSIHVYSRAFWAQGATPLTHCVATETVPARYRSLKMAVASLCGKCSICVYWGSIAWTRHRLSVHRCQKSL